MCGLIRPQMSGRAGRRGLDTFGNVVINCKDDELPDEAAVRAMVCGPSGQLESKFRLTYGMIINLLRVEDMPGALCVSANVQSGKINDLPIN